MSALLLKSGPDQRPHQSDLVPKADITRMSKSVQCVLEDLPVFHDQAEIPAGVSNEIEVLKWITLHHDKVGQCVLLNYAEFAWIWIAKR